jgi:hypothetical protein
MSSPRAALAIVLAALALASGPAYAGGAKSKSARPPAATYDVSYPQCGKTLPGAITGGIVGVNNGVALSANPCLATEWSWATKGTAYAPAFYANTGDPGPAHSSHWPTGQTSPQVCDPATGNSTACSYDYGWNYAIDAVNRARAVTSTANTAMWWLDVETGNSWQTLESAYGQTATSRANDQASLAGAIAALQQSGVATVGVYSTSYQWTQITGGTGTQFAAQPAWVAGVGSLSTAQNNCRSISFTGGRVTLTQYAQSGYDADYHC